MKCIMLSFRKIFLSKRFTNRHKRNCFYIIVVYIFFFCLYYFTRQDREESFFETYQTEWNDSTDGCVFPDLAPFSKVARRFDRSMPKVVCDDDDWVECETHRIDNHHLSCISNMTAHLNKETIARSSVKENVVRKPACLMRLKVLKMTECYVKKKVLDTMDNVVCLYKDIVYVDDHYYTISDPDKVLAGGRYNLNASDSFKVSCYGYENNGSTNVSKSGMPLPGLTKWLWLSKRWYGYKSGVRPLSPPSPPPPPGDGVNVLIVGFDSASHHGFLRKMPKSYKTLVQDLDAVVLHGYNIVGDGTPDALFPILSGKTELEHHSSARQRYSKQVLLNPDLFIFHTAKEHGYETAYYEDMPWIGSFQWRYNGFSGMPADHYIRSLLMEATGNGIKWHNGVQQRYCLGGTPQYLFMLDLTEKFMNLTSKRFCFTFIGDISHDDLNMISTADDDFVRFLLNLRGNGILNNTLLIVMGDHGPRFTPMRKHYQGKIEERMPFVSLVLPQSLQLERPEAVYHLKENSKVLTTPFDIHSTVLDAMGLRKFGSKFVAPKGRMLRGLSLLREIPKIRNCEDAAILPHWCVCLNRKWYNVASTDRLYRSAANALAEFVNNVTLEKRNVCEVRKLMSVEWVIRQDASIDVTNSTYYQAMIVMSPGRAVYEGSMQYVPSSDQFVISEADVSRISAYGDEPNCVSATHPHMNKYCFCKNKRSVLSYFNF